MKARVWRAVALGALTVGLAGSVAAPVGATTKSQLQGETLSLSNMPTGWSVENSATGTGTDLAGCLQGLRALGLPAKGIARANVTYHRHTVPAFEETLESGKGALPRYERYLRILETCKQVSVTTSKGIQVSGSVKAMTFPTVGSSSSAFALDWSAEGVNVGTDIVMFRAGQVDGRIAYGDYSPDRATLQALVTAAVDKVEGKPVPAMPSN
jgi:hypothetical protein